MDWSNERYVRVYTRDTADDLVLSWEAFSLWPLLLRKADRAGVIATNHGPRGIAALVRWPLDVVDRALPELLADGRISACHEPCGYVIPNYIQAQEATSSDAQRKREERERRSSRANKSVAERDTQSRSVKNSHVESQRVTSGHSVPSRSDPCLAVPSQDRDPDPPPSAPVRVIGKLKGCTPEEEAAAAEVLSRLATRSGRKYGSSGKHQALVISRLRAGYSVWDLRRVIGYCAYELGWEDKPAMQPFLRPETLFGPEAMEKYVYAARAWNPSETPPPDEPQRAAPKPALAIVKNSSEPVTDEWSEPEWMTAMTTPR